MTRAANIISTAMAETDPAERVQFLKEVLAYAAAGIVTIEGERKAYEAVRRVGDAIVGVTKREGARHG